MQEAKTIKSFVNQIFFLGIQFDLEMTKSNLRN
jgi:hypothetical protein